MGHWTDNAATALLGPNALMVGCPTCGAPKGKPCTGSAGCYCRARVVIASGQGEPS